MSFAFKVALRFLTSNKAQMFLITLGIAVGISVQIFIGLLIQGLQNDLINSTIGSSAHLTITSDELFEDGQLYDELLANEEISKVNYVLAENVFLKEQTLILNGILFETENDIYQLEQKVVEGNLPAEDNTVMLGITYQDKYSVGEEVFFRTSEGEVISYKISGFFDFNVASVNENFAYANLANLQNVLNSESSIDRIEVQITNVFDSQALKDKLDLPDSYEVITWEEENAELLSGLNGQSVSSLMIQIFVLVSVVLAIASVLIISVVQKQKQIGILKAMGVKNSTSRLIFLFQGLILGFLGSTLGIGLGIGLLLAFTTFAVNPDGEAIITITYSVRFIFTSFIIGISAAVIAAIIPARKSVKLTPMEVIRND